MRLSRPIALLVLATMPGASAHAREAIHRCIDAAGHPVFTDRRCGALDATPVRSAAGGAALEPTTGLPGGADVQRCAADPAALRRQVLEAFARHHPNRLAGLMLWDDYGERGAMERMRDLRSLVDQPLLDLQEDPESAQPTAAAAEPAASIYDASRPLRDQLEDPAARTSDPSGAQDPQALVASTRDVDGSRRDTRFPVARRAGCLWLLPPAG